MTIDIERLKVDAAYWDEVAPEGATHFIPKQEHEEAAWMKPSDSGYAVWKCKLLGWEIWVDDPSAEKQEHLFIPRPTTKQWDGEGLPPVGCECEYQLKHDEVHDEWSRCIIKYFGERHCITDTWPDESASYPLEQSFRLKEVKFRPIKSAAEREKEETINEAHEVLRDLPVTASSLDALYDAGMLRKREG